MHVYNMYTISCACAISRNTFNKTLIHHAFWGTRFQRGPIAAVAPTPVCVPSGSAVAGGPWRSEMGTGVLVPADPLGIGSWLRGALAIAVRLFNRGGHMTGSRAPDPGTHQALWGCGRSRALASCITAAWDFVQGCCDSHSC